MSYIFEILDKAAKRLKAAEIDTARLDAEVLLAHVLRVKRVDLVLKRDKAITNEQHVRFSKLIDERARRRPVSQLIGMREFWSLPIAVNEHVLTPRPETEGIVEFALNCFPRETRLRVLDLCTGSGCIAAALAVEFPRARITATDISEKALKVAKTNLAFAANRTTLLNGDLFDVLTPPLCKGRLGGVETRSTSPNPSLQRRGTFDLIVANPPYIDKDEYKNLPPEVRDYEPLTALAADERGLAILRKISQYAPRYINSGGWLVLEVGMGQAYAVRDMLLDTGSFSAISINRDLAGIERIVAAQRS